MRGKMYIERRRGIVHSSRIYDLHKVLWLSSVKRKKKKSESKLLARKSNQMMTRDPDTLSIYLLNELIKAVTSPPGVRGGDGAAPFKETAVKYLNAPRATIPSPNNSLDKLANRKEGATLALAGEETVTPRPDHSSRAGLLRVRRGSKRRWHLASISNLQEKDLVRGDLSDLLERVHEVGIRVLDVLDDTAGSTGVGVLATKSVERVQDEADVEPVSKLDGTPGISPKADVGSP